MIWSIGILIGINRSNPKIPVYHLKCELYIPVKRNIHISRIDNLTGMLIQN